MTIISKGSPYYGGREPFNIRAAREISNFYKNAQLERQRIEEEERQRIEEERRIKELERKNTLRRLESEANNLGSSKLSEAKLKLEDNSETNGIWDSWRYNK